MNCLPLRRKNVDLDMNFKFKTYANLLILGNGIPTISAAAVNMRLPAPSIKERNNQWEVYDLSVNIVHKK